MFSHSFCFQKRLCFLACVMGTPLLHLHNGTKDACNSNTMQSQSCNAHTWHCSHACICQMDNCLCLTWCIPISNMVHTHLCTLMCMSTSVCVNVCAWVCVCVCSCLNTTLHWCVYLSATLTHLVAPGYDPLSVATKALVVAPDPHSNSLSWASVCPCLCLYDVRCDR